MTTLPFFTIFDLLGTFAFAISGAVAAKQRGLDLFGIISVAFTVACGGGIIRDVCIGATPPAGLTHWVYLATSILATAVTIAAYPLVRRLSSPVLLFDAFGLGLFAVTGAHKALMFQHNAEAAILLGMITAVGGGVIRDVLLNRIPVILQKEIYASIALLGAAIQVAGESLQWPQTWSPMATIVLCIALRYLSLRYHWNLPVFVRPSSEKNNDA